MVQGSIDPRVNRQALSTRFLSSSYVILGLGGCCLLVSFFRVVTAATSLFTRRLANVGVTDTMSGHQSVSTYLVWVCGAIHWQQPSIQSCRIRRTFPIEHNFQLNFRVWDCVRDSIEPRDLITTTIDGRPLLLPLLEPEKLWGLGTAFRVPYLYMLCEVLVTRSSKVRTGEDGLE